MLFARLPAVVAGLLFPGVALAAPWLYQLQNPEPAQVAASGFRAAVLDYSRDGTEAGRLPAEGVRGLAQAGIRPLAYLSIGEAENYRFYWRTAWEQQPPAWLGRTNPDWAGNFKVRYWDAAWRTTVLRPYLRRIVAQGFRGVYLDIIDAFEYWADPASYGPGRETYRAGDPRGDRAEAARRMVDLVRWIARETRATAGQHFWIVPQNGEEILRFDAAGRYRRVINGLGVEDLFFNETRRKSAAETSYRLGLLRPLRAAGKRILCVDYVDTGDRSDPANAARIREFVRRCDAEGFDFYAGRSDRALDRINAIPGVQP